MTRTLPDRPDLQQLRTQAKDLRKAALARRPDAIEAIAGVSGNVTLSAAQTALARQYGFASWTRLKSFVDDAQRTRQATAGPARRSGRRAPARSIGTIHVRIDGTDLPGRRCGPDLDGLWYENVHVGLARGTATEDLIPGDADRARWAFDVDLRESDTGAFDFGGPFVHGPRDERHLGLRWVREDDDGQWVVFRGAKFRLFEMDAAIFEAAAAPGRHLVGRLALTDELGWPRCATVRPPLIEWTVE